MLLAGKQTFPLLGIGNITLEKDNINVKAFFSGDNKTIKEFLRKNAKLAAYSKVYFMVSVPKDMESKTIIPPGILQNPQKRFSNIARYFRMSTMNSLGWYNNLKKRYYTATIPLDEIFGRPDAITKPELTKNKNISDVNFEINIPIDESLYERTDTQEVYLHAFVMMDIKEMIDSGEIKKISSSINGYTRIGSNLRTKKILQIKEDKLSSPDKKTILTLENGQAYNGKYQNISGKGLMTLDRKPLVRKEVTEKTISADYFVEKNAKPVGSPPPEETKKTLGYSFSKPIIQVTKSDIKKEDLKEELYYPKYLDNLTKDLVIKQIKDPDSSYIMNSVHTVDTKSDQAHKVHFVVDWEKIVKNKTKLGYLVDVANKSKHLNNLITLSTTGEKSFSAADILTRVMVKELFLKRTRKGTQDTEVLTSISDYSFSRPYEDEKVSLEVRKDTYSRKTMLVKDYHLFKNPHSGDYYYTLEMSFEDKNIEYFSTLLSDFRDSLKNIDMMLDSIDYTPSVKKEILNKGKIRDEGDLPVQSFTSVSNCIDTYLLLLCWFGKEYTREEFIKLRSDLFTMASLSQGGTIAGLQKFREYCEIMANNLDDMLAKTKEKINTDSVATKKNSRKIAKDSLMQREEFVIPGISSAIEQEQILLSFPAGITSDVIHTEDPTVNNGLISIEPTDFLYKKKDTTRLITTKRKIVTENNPIKKDNVLLILDDAIKSDSTGARTLDKIETEKPLLDFQNVFGIPGVSVAVPTSEGVFNSSDISKKNISKDAEADAKASLGTAIKGSITASIPNKTGVGKLSNQNVDKQDADSVELKRNTVLTKTMKMLSMLEDRETKHKKGSKQSAKIDTTASIEDNIFKHRSGFLTLGVPTTSGELEFRPLTLQALEETQEEEVVVKIQDSMSKSKKEKYKSVDNVFESTKTSLENLLKENR